MKCSDSGYDPEKDVCEKCDHIFNEPWQSGVTYNGIDRHHNPPEEIARFQKRLWKGEFYNLCRECHKKLHSEIKVIIKKYSNNKKANSDYWLMQYCIPEKLIEAEKEIYEFTKKWVKKDDTATT